MAPNAEATPMPSPVLAARAEIVTVMSTIISENKGQTDVPKPKKVAVGPIIGGLVGGIAAGILGAVLIWWYIRHRRKNQEAIRRAYIRRKQRQLAQYNKARSTHSGPSSGASSTIGGSTISRSTVSPPILKTPPTSLSEKDPYGGIVPPMQVYQAPKSFDPYVAEHGYGFEQQPMQYFVPATGQYFVQGGYDPSLLQPNVLPSQFVLVPEQPDVDQAYYAPSIHSRHSISPPARNSVSPPWSYNSGQQSISPPSSASVSPPSSQSTSPPSSIQSSPPSSPPSSSVDARRKSRGAQRAAVADQAAANAAVPPTQRHRPSRPSPLSLAPHRREASAGDDHAFADAEPSPFLTPESSDTSHAYAAAAGGQWGIALGSPDHDRFDFNRASAEELRGEDAEPSTPTSPPTSGPQSTDDTHVLRTPSLNHDPFSEYQQYARYADDGTPKRWL